MQQEDFVNAKNNEQAQRALFAWVNSRNIDFATGETFVPSEKYNNFALALAISLKTENQSTIQKRLNKIFDLIQGTQEENLFEKPDNTPKTKEEAIKEIFNIDYNGRKGSTILESNSRNSQRWGRGSNGNPSSKEQTQSGNGTSDNRGRTSTNAEQVTELTPEEKSKKAFEAVRKAVEKAGLVIHEATPEMVDSISGGSDIEMRYIEKTNNNFNKNLQKQIDGILPNKYIYNLGLPSSILRSTGIPNLPIQLNSTRLLEKSEKEEHSYNLSEIKDFVKELNNPIAVFAYGDRDKAQNIILEIQSNGKNFLVGLSIRPEVKGNVLEINSIRNIFPKDNEEWLNWIQQDKALYLDKKRIQDLINQQRINLADVEYLNLNSIANIIKNFENPKISPDFHLRRLNKQVRI